jgi:hypothetical protein
MKREKTQINKIRHEKGKINTNTKKIKYDHPKLNQGNLHHLNRSIVSNETEAEITK